MACGSRVLVQRRLHSPSGNERVAATAAQILAVFFARICWNPWRRGLIARCSRFCCSCRAAGSNSEGRRTAVAGPAAGCLCARAREMPAAHASFPGGAGGPAIQLRSRWCALLRRAGCSRRAPPEALRTNSQASSPRSWRVDLVPFEDSNRRSRRQQQQHLAEQGGQEGVVAA